MTRKKGPYSDGRERQLGMLEVMKKMHQVESEYNVVVRTTEWLAAMEGGTTICVRVSASKPSMDAYEAPYSQVMKRWPNYHNQSYFGLVFWMLHLLEDELVKLEGPVPF
jgi:hypothetical protein